MLFDDPETEDEDDFFDVPEDTKRAPLAAEPADELKIPRLQSNLIGHVENERKLLDLIAAGKLSQSIIFTGPAGIGKSTMAYRLARYLFKYKNNDDSGGLFGGFDAAPPAPMDSLSIPDTDPISQQVASGGFPDLLIIEREEDERGKLKVHDLEKVRAITSFFRRTASHDGGWRIAIIDDADTMNRQSQNALLKILEEPPAKSLLILISHRLGAMLPTILSRTSVYHFKPLADAEIRTFLHRYADPKPQETEDRIVTLAEGSIGRALYYAEPSCSDTIDQTLMMFEDWPKLDWTRVQMFADSIGARGSDEASQTAFKDALTWLINSLVRAKSLGQGTPKGLDNQAFSLILAEHSLASLLKICDTLKQHFATVQQASLDKRFMVMGAYAAFAETH